MMTLMMVMMMMTTIEDAAMHGDNCTCEFVCIPAFPTDYQLGRVWKSPLHDITADHDFQQSGYQNKIEEISKYDYLDCFCIKHGHIDRWPLYENCF